ncbi:MAG: hypothetical protein ACE5ER_04110 [Nitrospinaceae bacterium]
MDERLEKLIVALMVLLDEQGGECRLQTESFNRMFAERHRKGIQVKEMGDQGIVLKLGDMPVSPDDAMFN